MLSFAKSFTFKGEGMCLQHLPTLGLKGNEPDGLQIEENLGRSKRHFSLCETNCEAQFKPNVTSLFVHALNRVPTRAKPPAFHPDGFSVKKRYFPLDRFTGYKKSNQNQLRRALPFAFALTCYKIYLNMHHCNVL